MKARNTRYFRDRLKEDLQNSNFARLYWEERDKLNLAVKLAKLRKKSGLTQEQLAKRMNTRQQIISRFESGQQKNLTVRTLMKIAGATGHTVKIDFAPK